MMKTKKLWLPLLMFTAALVWIGGCSESPTSTTSTDSTNLVDEFGGYKATPEQPGFGDAALIADSGSEVEVNDPLLASPEVTPFTSDPEAGLFHLRAIWGQIPIDTLATDPIDWTGSLTISRGAEIVRRLIRFEDGQDYLLDRTDRKLIEWVSTTTIANDGIAVDLFVPPPKPVLDSTEVIDVDTLGDTTISYVIDTLPPEPVTVTFATGPYSRTFSLPELARLDTVVELDNGASVAFHAMQLFRVPCPGGFVIGGWGYDDQGQGRFRGRWMNYGGEITGYLRGHFGQTQNGRRVMFGKWINKAGDCEGFLRGIYEPLRHRFGNDQQSDQQAGGMFRARVYNANREPIGELNGRYESAPDRAAGFFQGRWRLDCARPDNDGMIMDDGLEPME